MEQKKFTAIWTFLDEDGMEQDSVEASFDTLNECRQWLSNRLTDCHYDCLVINNATNKIALTGWLA